MMALVIAVVMVLGMTGVTAFAQDKEVGGGTGTITVENAANGETYKLVKIFDATYNSTTKAIAYTGDIPEALTDYFEKNSNNQIVVKSGADITSADASEVFKTWAESQTGTSETSDGTTLNFTKVPYGYYVVTTTQGALVAIDSTTPTATVYDKNTKEFTVSKTADDKDVTIGQTVNYTVSINAPAYQGSGSTAKQVAKYTIKDTLNQAFLSNVVVDKIMINNTEYKVEGAVPQFDSNGEISIPWVDQNNKTLYPNNTTITITYHGTVAGTVAIDGDDSKDEDTADDGGNINTVTLTQETTDGTKITKTDKEEIYTYAAALQKVDENKAPLAGAEFEVVGLTVTGSAGDYTVVSYDSTATGTKATLVCDSDGQIVLKGLASDQTVPFTESKAPDGYNLLPTDSSHVFTPTKVRKILTVQASTTYYYDANGHVTKTEIEGAKTVTKETYDVDLLRTAIVVVNNKGAELPETGGIGTTIFYILGAILVIGAAILLVTRRRMSIKK